MPARSADRRSAIERTARIALASAPRPEQLQRHHDREDCGDGQQHHRQLVHHAAEHDVAEQDGADHDHRRHLQMTHPVRQVRRHLRQREGRVHQVGAEEDHEDQRRGLGGAEDTATDGLAGQLATTERRDEVPSAPTAASSVVPAGRQLQGPVAPLSARTNISGAMLGRPPIASVA
jgi:hypothetical protein